MRAMKLSRVACLHSLGRLQLASAAMTTAVMATGRCMIAELVTPRGLGLMDPVAGRCGSGGIYRKLVLYDKQLDRQFIQSIENSRGAPGGKTVSL